MSGLIDAINKAASPKQYQTGSVSEVLGNNRYKCTRGSIYFTVLSPVALAVGDYVRSQQGHVVYASGLVITYATIDLTL